MNKWNLTQRLDFHRRKVAWDVQGTGAPLVVVHGTPWSSFNMRHLIAGLSANYQVFYFDLLGYGQSDQSPGDVSLSIQNEVLAALIKHWQLDTPIALGHDFGGTTVLRAHLLNGMVYKLLILIDPVALSPWGSEFFRHVRQHEAAFSGMPDYIHAAVVEAYIKSAAYQALPNETIAGILRPWKGKLGKAAFYRQIAQADSRYTDEIQDQYPALEVPTLILWGEEDTWIPLAKGEKLHQLIPHSVFNTLPDTGHLVIEEAPGQLLITIQNFLKLENSS